MSAKLTKAELLEVWRRDLDPGYTLPLETQDDGRGFDVIAGLAAMLERASTAVLNSTQALYLKEHSTQLAAPASGGVRATYTIDITRAIIVGGPIPLDDGDLLAAVFRNPDGELVLQPEFEIIGDVTIPSGATGPTLATVRAAREGFHGNIPLGTPLVFVHAGNAAIVVDNATQSGGSLHVFADIDAGDRFTPTMTGLFFRFTEGVNIGQYARALTFVNEDEAYLDASGSMPNQTGGAGEVVGLAELGLSAVIVEQLEEGRSAELDYLALERNNQARALAETDPQFRQRVASLPDVVSPNALIRAASAVLAPLGVPFQFFEAFGPGVGFVWTGDTLPAEDAGHAYSDPRAWRKGRFYAGPATANGTYSIGFLFVVNGDALSELPDGPGPALSALSRSISNIKGGAVPWGIAFEPPIPVIMT